MSKVTLELTLLEARAMQWAAEESTDHPDVMESLFQNGRERLAAWRAVKKLRSALRVASTEGA